jgi:hypothetical protein
MMICPTKIEAEHQASMLACMEPKDFDNGHPNWSNHYDEFAEYSPGLQGKYRMNIMVKKQSLNEWVEY